jgi:hypothetical protein
MNAFNGTNDTTRTHTLRSNLAKYLLNLSTECKYCEVGAIYEILNKTTSHHLETLKSNLELDSHYQNFYNLNPLYVVDAQNHNQNLHTSENAIQDFQIDAEVENSNPIQRHYIHSVNNKKTSIGYPFPMSFKGYKFKTPNLQNPQEVENFNKKTVIILPSDLVDQDPKIIREKLEYLNNKSQFKAIGAVYEFFRLEGTTLFEIDIDKSLEDDFNKFIESKNVSTYINVTGNKVNPYKKGETYLSITFRDNETSEPIILHNNELIEHENSEKIIIFKKNGLSQTSTLSYSDFFIDQYYDNKEDLADKNIWIGENKENQGNGIWLERSYLDQEKEIIDLTHFFND